MNNEKFKLNKTNILNMIYIILFVSFVTFIGFYNVVKDDVTFSEGENRELKKFPEITKEKVFSGKFSSEFEIYLNDNFKNKESWLVLKSLAEKLQLRVKSDDMYYGTDGYLFEKYDEPGEQYLKNVEYINYFDSKFNKDIKTYVLLAPTSIEIYNEKLPKYADSYSQKLVLDKIKNSLNKTIGFIDVYDNLVEDKDSYIYFKTDHHWTSRGAFDAYLESSKVMNFSPYSKGDFNIKTVSDEFKGTYYSKVNMLGLKDDKIEVFNPKFENDIKVNYVDDMLGLKTNDKNYQSNLYENELNSSNNKEIGLYNDFYLSKKDKYSYFLNGNNSLVEIKNESNNNGKNLLIIKDSYSHVFIPFLSYHYENISVIDLRYYKNDIESYINENNINEVLILYNLVTFSEDKSIIFLKR